MDLQGTRPKPETGSVKVGDRVFFSIQGRRYPGTVRFHGDTHFSDGEWFGLELDEKVGRNDGSVNGVSYFKCSAEHGIFCRQNRLQKVSTNRMSQGAISMMKQEDDEGDIHVPDGHKVGDGARMELLERLWDGLNPDDEFVLSLRAFKQLMSILGEQDQNAILALHASISEASSEGLDFHAFVQLCGPRNLDLDASCLQEACDLVAGQTVGTKTPTPGKATHKETVDGLRGQVVEQQQRIKLLEGERAASQRRIDALEELTASQREQIEGLAALVISSIYDAAERGDEVRLRGLLRDYPDGKNGASTRGATPAFVAAQLGHAKALAALAEVGADLDKATEDDTTPTFIAAQGGHTAALQVLVKAGADLDKARHDGTTPACMAAQDGHAGALSILAGAGADLNRATDDGFTPALIAAHEGHSEALRLLAEARADLNKATPSGATPAFMAAQEGHVKALQILVAARADLNRAKANGTTPVHKAAQKGHAKVLQVLVEAKADPHKVDENGSTPARLAEAGGHDEALGVLKSAAAHLPDIPMRFVP